MTTTHSKPAWPILVFAASAALALLMGAMRIEVPLLQPPRHFSFFDLKIYRDATGLVTAGRPLYGAPLRDGLGFTYPPIAAVMFLALRGGSIGLDEVAVTLLNVAFVAVIAHRTVALRQPATDIATEPRRVATPWLLAAAALWIEPVWTAIGYGQIDLLIAALVVVDLTRPRGSRWAGVGVGVAAALKLTPLVFIPYLLFTGRRREAGRAGATFAASVAASFATLPGDARTYWGGTFLDSSRVTGYHPHAGAGPANQSLRGALLRIAPNLPHVSQVWALACVLVGSLGLLLAVLASRRGDEAWGFTLTAITGLLVCPVSWTHHWVIAVPGLLLVLVARRSSVAGWARTAMAVVFALGSSTIWFVIARHPTGEHLGVGGLLLGNLYVLAGLGAIGVAGVLEARRLLGRLLGHVTVQPVSGSSRMPVPGNAA